jgi:malto-oligosyltrehalose trehalohydrolase
MVDPASVPIEKLHRLLGAHPLENGSARFCVWAPTHDRVFVLLTDQGRRVEMSPLREGYHAAEVNGVVAGELYQYEFSGRSDEAGATARPDPASRFQPRGVHGPSMVVAPYDQWNDHRWKDASREELIVYELHVGTFTQAGTYPAAIDRLDELVDLGITAIELMPLADAAGRWNWGYDGVNLFAPNHNYGSPEELSGLIDAAHSRGLAVFLDVVYNHLGPEGNYLGDCGPYLSVHHHTPWGAAPNFDDPTHGAQLRRFFIANAIHWLDAYHFDGLRIDAIHCMRDDSERHVVAELAQGVRDWSRESGRSALLIAESNVYDPNMLMPLEDGGMGFDAEWCDDFLHSVFAVARPGEHLCHRTYHAGKDLDQTLRFGFVYEGSLREQRGRRTPTRRVLADGLVYSIQHHDFIGNHPLGKRLHQRTSLDFQRAAAALMLLCPAVPMLFMGEEFACEHPFKFFVDFTDDPLRRSVVDGRKREYPQHDWSAGTLPIDDEAFLDSKIGAAEDGNLEMRSWYQRLIALRKDWRDRRLLSDANLSVVNDIDAGLFSIRYRDRGVLATVAVQLSEMDSGPKQIRLAEWMEEELGELVLDSRPKATAPGDLQENHAKVFVRKRD